MSSHLVQQLAQRFAQSRPQVKTGFTVRVHEKIKEGNKERVQIFEGLVISVHNGHSPADRSFTVRKIVSGIGVEKVFALHSPNIQKIEVKKVAKVRRAKLFFIRGRTGKAARMNERFTEAGEFEPTMPKVVEKKVEEAKQAVEEKKEEEAPTVA